jgi:excisionase family DNA binding protein
VENLFSVVDAAKRLGGISPYTLRHWLSQGKLRFTKIGGRTMIRESDLQTMIRDGSQRKSARPKHRGQEPNGVRNPASVGHGRNPCPTNR